MSAARLKQPYICRKIIAAEQLIKEFYESRDHQILNALSRINDKRGVESIRNGGAIYGLLTD